MEGVQRGHLKIFFSYGESIGKTYAMLKAASGVKAQGLDVWQAVWGLICPKRPLFYWKNLRNLPPAQGENLTWTEPFFEGRI